MSHVFLGERGVPPWGPRSKSVQGPDALMGLVWDTAGRTPRAPLPWGGPGMLDARLPTHLPANLCVSGPARGRYHLFMVPGPAQGMFCFFLPCQRPYIGSA